MISDVNESETPATAPGSEPRFDREAVHAHISLLHERAQQARTDLKVDGVLVLACYGENPESKAKIPAKVTRYAIGDVKTMVDEIMGMESEPHRNVYIPWHIMPYGLTGSARGELKDIVAVLALVVDQDADAGKTFGKLPAQPHYVIESSPGNKQPVFILSQALPPKDALPLAKALSRMTKTDSGTGDIDHVWRVPGTLNWPNAKKVSNKRPSTPALVKVIQPWTGKTIGEQVLRERLQAHYKQDEKPSGGSSQQGTAAGRDELVARLKAKIFGGEVIGWLNVASIDKDEGDRSKHSCRVIGKLFEHGFNEAEVFVLMWGTPCAGRYGSEKLLRDDIARLKGKRTEQQPAGDEDEITRALRELDENNWLMRKQSKTRIMSWRMGGNKFRRQFPCYQTRADFELLHANRIVMFNGKQTPVTKLWVTNPDRVTYDGDIYAPDQPPIVDNRVNLWTGWGCTPRAGVWDRMRAHIYEVLADGDNELGDYIIKWIAWLFQHPAERAEVAIVLGGMEGTGKGTLGNALLDIVGRQHSCHLTSTQDIGGHFNNHLANVSFVFADEATWGGDKQGEGRLKALITEPQIPIEPKGLDKEQVDNAIHMLVSSNSGWIVPAGEKARRFVVCDVSDAHARDEAWFGPIYEELENGGKEAMFQELRNMDLGDWHPRRIIQTTALQEQQMRGLSPEDEWWVGLLHDGCLPAATDRYPDRALSGEYYDLEGHRRRGLFEHARMASPRLKTCSDRAIGNYLTSKGCANMKYLRKQCWRFPPLDEARAAWEVRFGVTNWTNPCAGWFEAE